MSQPSTGVVDPADCRGDPWIVDPPRRALLAGLALPGDEMTPLPMPCPRERVTLAPGSAAPHTRSSRTQRSRPTTGERNAQLRASLLSLATSVTVICPG